MWVLLNVSCGSNTRDVLAMPEKLVKGCRDVLVVPEGHVKSCKSSENKASDGERHLFHERTVRDNHAHTMYYELKVGDPARNIIEMIFQRASINPFKPSRKIETILRVNNSIEMLEKFERYREKVKKKAYYEQYKTHPRCAVDGNELLRFYGTTITCCSENSKTASLLCKDMVCRACRIVQSNFNTEHTRENGILLSTSSEEVCDNLASFKKVKNNKRAVIVCRIIAGMTSHMADEDCVSFQSEGQQSLIVRNPCAVLPCFVIVISIS